MPERPTRLYKYQPVSARTLENLQHRTIWFSAPAAFNDPFDCAADVLFKPLDDEDLERALTYMRGRGALTPELESKVTTDGRPNERFRTMFDRVLEGSPMPGEIASIRARIGVACFSEKNDDMLMWAHYADGHRGLALEFDTSFEPFTMAEPVKYQHEFPIVNPLDLLDGRSTSQNIVEAMLRAKHKCWSYEREWRALHKEAGTAYGAPYQSLTGVFFGAAMSDGTKDLISALLHGASVQLHEMRARPDGFGLHDVPLDYTPYRGSEDEGAAR